MLRIPDALVTMHDLAILILSWLDRTLEITNHEACG
jgi:hypothetical protein